jgi:hypothetical protein
MLELNKITQAQYDEALNTELVILPRRSRSPPDGSTPILKTTSSMW